MAEVNNENWFSRTWNGLKRSCRELRSELKKIVWPTWSQVVKNALVVGACVLVVGLCIYAFDIFAKYAIQFILSIGR